MGILNRSLLFVYTLFFGVLCAGIVALCLHIVPERVVLNEYDYLANQWQTGAVAGVFLLVSIHLLLCSLSGSRSKEINAKELLVVQGATGQVNVSLAAIRDMAERLSASVNGVRMAKAKALVERRKDEGDFLKLDIRLEIGQERGIAAISDDVRTQVGRYVTQAAGIDNVELAVSVQGIASGVAVKKRRIR